jgi:hypothetical protein
MPGAVGRVRRTAGRALLAPVLESAAATSAARREVSAFGGNPSRNKGRRLYCRDPYRFLLRGARTEDDENHTEYRWQSFGSGGCHLVPARDQCTSWQFHDGTDSVGGFWRHRCCGGHRLIAEGQPHAKRLRERKDTQQHRRVPISCPRSGNTNHRPKSGPREGWPPS